MKFSNWQQGTPEWIEERRGRITGSRFRDALDTLKGGKMSSKAEAYAMDLARERAGGKAWAPFVSSEMRFGTEQEPEARMAYEMERGVLVHEVGFFATDDGFFGLSADGLVGSDGAVEIKTLCSSQQIFKVLVDQDYSDYIHQIMGLQWLLAVKWVDLILWTPDLPRKMHVVRFDRNDGLIDEMASKLAEFNKFVESLRDKLEKAL